MDDMHGLRAWDSARELEKVAVGIARKNRLPDPARVMSQLCRAANCSVAPSISRAVHQLRSSSVAQFISCAVHQLRSYR